MEINIFDLIIKYNNLVSKINTFWAEYAYHWDKPVVEYSFVIIDHYFVHYNEKYYDLAFDKSKQILTDILLNKVRVMEFKYPRFKSNY